MVNGTLLNFGKRYKDDLTVIFYQWPKLYLGLDALSNQKILKGIYYIGMYRRMCSNTNMVWSRPWEKCAIPLTSHANTKSIKNIAEKLETKKAH